ncbi:MULTISPECIES: hypothetical protein [unclassified Pannonibacter]|uniref:hypothetical protein n=1 Tax=unclassified Pannonibacter TaxID=2627228 RepID=UPI001647552C|nr:MULTISPECIES: hypothetical protein [unclassified Pannonibacter]
MSLKTEQKAKLKGMLEGHVQKEIADKGLKESQVKWRQKLIEDLCGDKDASFGSDNSPSVMNWLRSAGIDLISKSRLEKLEMKLLDGEEPLGKIRPPRKGEEEKKKADPDYQMKFLTYDFFVRTTDEVRAAEAAMKAKEDNAAAPGQAA